MPLVLDNALGLYVSVPFCRSKCTYCNFASGVYPAAEHDRYVDRLIQDLAAAPAWAESLSLHLPRKLDTIYFGGGTPSLLGPQLLARVFAAIRNAFDVDPLAEVTLECAPGQLPDETLAALVASGVNRVSLGVQSFIDREAAVSGRLHNRNIVFHDIHRLRAAGIANLSVDLIAGLPDQTLASWDESLTALVDTGVPHASIYMLEVDEDSRLGREMLAHGSRYHAGLVPYDDAIAQMYSTTIDRLAAAGLEQYEISNFSRPGVESRHNLRYWQRRPYLGIGLDASSALCSSPALRSAASPVPMLRATATCDLAAYLAGPSAPETNRLTSAQQHEEAWFLGLRRNCGVRIADIRHEFGPDSLVAALEAVERNVSAGLIAFDGEIVRLTPQGRLLANDALSEFVQLESAAPAAIA